MGTYGRAVATSSRAVPETMAKHLGARRVSRDMTAFGYECEVLNGVGPTSANCRMAVK